MYWKSGKIAEENIKATGKKKFQYFKFERAPSQNIKLEHLVYANRNNLRDLL